MKFSKNIKTIKLEQAKQYMLGKIKWTVNFWIWTVCEWSFQTVFPRWSILIIFFMFDRNFLEFQKNHHKWSQGKAVSEEKIYEPQNPPVLSQHREKRSKWVLRCCCVVWMSRKNCIKVCRSIFSHQIVAYKCNHRSIAHSKVDFFYCGCQFNCSLFKLCMFTTS